MKEPDGGFLHKALQHIDQLPSDSPKGRVREWQIVFYLVCAIVEALTAIARAIHEAP